MSVRTIPQFSRVSLFVYIWASRSGVSGSRKSSTWWNQCKMQSGVLSFILTRILLAVGEGFVYANTLCSLGMMCWLYSEKYVQNTSSRWGKTFVDVQSILIYGSCSRVNLVFGVSLAQFNNDKTLINSSSRGRSFPKRWTVPTDGGFDRQS